MRDTEPGFLFQALAIVDGPVRMNYAEWYRKSELSSDRANAARRVGILP